MKRLFPLFLSVIFLTFAVSGCGPDPSPTATPPSPTATPLRPMQTPPPTATPTEAVEAAQEPTAELPGLLERLHWLGHASFRLDGPPTIYFDPTSWGSESPQADVVLISHGHDDHYNPSILKRMSTPETVIVTSHNMATRLEKDGVPGEVRALRPGERTTVGDVEIGAVPAYNIAKSYHPRESENLGFVVTLDGERLYFAGDTDRIPEMADIRCDVALLPVGGTYTMDAEEAAQATADIGPKVAVPMHTRGTDPKQFHDLCDCEVVIMEMEHSQINRTWCHSLAAE